MFNHKVIFSKEFVNFYNEIPSDYSGALVENVKDAITCTDKNLSGIDKSMKRDESKEKRKLDDETPSSVGILVDKPKRLYLKPKTPKQIKQFANKISNMYDNDSFRNSQQYSDIMKLANSAHSTKDAVHFNKFALGRTDIIIRVCFIDPNHKNKITSNIGNLCKVVHYTVGFQTDDKEYDGMFPIDLVMSKAGK